MNYYFVFYPFCYISKRGGQVLVLDTNNHQYVLSSDQDVFSIANEKHNIREIAKESSKSVCDFLHRCVDKHMGYPLSAYILPFTQRNGLYVVSPYSKTKNLHNQMEGYYLYDNILEISFQLNNKHLNVESSLVSEQIDFPIEYKCNAVRWDIMQFVKGLERFPNLNSIKICGDIDDDLFVEVYHSVLSYPIYIRTSCHTSNLSKIQYILDNNPKVRLEVLVLPQDINNDNSIYTNKVFKNERVTLCPIIYKPKELDLFSSLNNIMPVPVLENPIKQRELLYEMKISIDDICQQNQSLSDIYKKEEYNTSCFGTIEIKNNGDVTCMGESFGNLS